MYNRRRSILLAENDRSIAQALRLHLERAGFSVFVARDGEQAAILAARQRFELIVTDLDLPIMSGLEFCSHVRNVLGLGDVPIAAIASAQETENDDAEHRYGITRMLSRPVDPNSVVNVACECIRYPVATI
jgi:DNA-binding response OmpR family regulator